jgi:four helix bundle protein
MAIIHDDEFLAWECGVPESLKGDPAWRFNAYRVSLFMLDRVRRDLRTLPARRTAAPDTDQLTRSIASISANIAEGLGRMSAAERCRFFGIALGSLRESQAWYAELEDFLPPGTAELRLNQLSQLRRLLIGAQKWLRAKPQKSQLM